MASVGLRSIESLSVKQGTPLLLHACCGPCSLEPLKHLREEGFEPTICWTNPNIQPIEEHDKRLQTLLIWAREEAHVEVIIAGDPREKWERSVAPQRFERDKRCRACYAIRLAESCRVAVERGFEYVSTTLAVSPYQLFDACEDELISIAHAYGLIPVWRDFRPYYAEATKESRELGMYRQNYCGCRYSAAESQIERHEARDARKAARHAN
ncbi:MAG: epoxyqueuosine reductase QueH [Atopobiaceae bacterium]|nr:epoxyqueuosine reductase QueH [Atopobiaceae bacterium]